MPLTEPQIVQVDQLTDRARETAEAATSTAADAAARAADLASEGIEKASELAPVAVTAAADVAEWAARRTGRQIVRRILIGLAIVGVVVIVIRVLRGRSDDESATVQARSTDAESDSRQSA